MVIRTFSYPFCRYPYIAGFNASQTYRYILNIITFTENLFRSKGPFSCLIESFIITGYRNLYQARFMYSHTITGYATNSEGIHLLHLLHIYSKRDRIIIRPRTPFKVRILQASTYPVSQKFLIRITSRHRFGGCQIPTNRKRQCLSHLSAFHKSSTFKIQCLFYGQFFFIKRWSSYRFTAICRIMYFCIRPDTFQFHFQCSIFGSHRVLNIIHRTGIDNSFCRQMFIINIHCFQKWSPILFLRLCPCYLRQCSQTGKY